MLSKNIEMGILVSVMVYQLKVFFVFPSVS